MSGQNEMVIRPKFHHVTLKTTQLQEMIDWYAKVVGVETTFQFPGGAWVSNDDANHRIAFLQSPQLKGGPEKITYTGMHHMAFEYGSIDGLLDTFSRLKEMEILPHATLDHGMTTSFYYADPDDNSVELQYDNFGDWAKSKEWMKTAPEFSDNPIGAPVDPEKMVEARKIGISAEQIHERAYAGEWPTEIDPRIQL